MTEPTSARDPGSGEPVFHAPPVTTVLVVTIVSVFVLLQLLPQGLATAAEDLFSLVPARVAVAVANPWQPGTVIVAISLFSHALLHLDLMHLVANAGFLLAFGSVAERGMGRGRYIRLLLLSVLAGAGAQLVVDWERWISLLGVSAAASGCLAAVVRLLLNDPAQDPRRRRFAVALLVVGVLVNVVFAILGPNLLPISGEIAWEAHLGGFAAGYLLSGKIGPRR